VRREHRAGIVAAAALIALAAVLVVLISNGGRSRPSGTVPAVTTTTATPTIPKLQFGANVNRLFNDFSYTRSQIDAELAALHATGVTLARSDALWELSEPAAPTDGVHHYDWSFDDRIAMSLATHGLRWLPIVDYTAPWAESVPGQDHAPPKSVADYAAYAAALAARYGTGGSFWREHPSLPPLPAEEFEIWNEPDNPSFWVPTPNPAVYGHLYGVARTAIRAVDPTAAVLVGGLIHSPGFLSTMLAANPDLRTEIDGVALHPYAANPAGVISNVVRARRALDDLGLAAAPLYVTEFGWTTSPPGAISYLPERLRPTYIEETTAGLARIGCALAAVILYTWVTPERDPANSGDWYGINPPGGGGPDVTAFTNAIRSATRRATAGACS
jgi:hypothetical protein